MSESSGVLAPNGTLIRSRTRWVVL